MEEVIEIAHHILDEHYKYYTKNSLDDTEMIKELRNNFIRAKCFAG